VDEMLYLIVLIVWVCWSICAMEIFQNEKDGLVPHDSETK